MTPKKQEVPEQACLRQHLQRIRKAAKLTQQELAEKLSRPQSYISKIENGARGASFLEVRAFCQACKVDFGKFIKGLEADLSDTD